MGEKRVINRNGKRESWLASISSVFHSKGFSFFFFFKISIVINYPASPGKGWILNKANEKTAKKKQWYGRWWHLQNSHNPTIYTCTKICWVLASWPLLILLISLLLFCFEVFWATISYWWKLNSIENLKLNKLCIWSENSALHTKREQVSKIPKDAIVFLRSTKLLKWKSKCFPKQQLMKL